MAVALISGGAGFIGSHLAQALLTQGDDVVIVDNFDSYYPPEIKKRNLDMVRQTGAVTFIQGDAGDYAAMRSLLQKHQVDVVFHEAAHPGVRASLAKPLATHQKNVLTALHLLQAATEAEVDCFVNASSSSVYGEPESLPLKETHCCQPLSPYGASKLSVEAYVYSFYEVYDLPAVSLRYFTVYGPRMRPDLAIFHFTQQLLDGEPPIVFGDGTQRRDFTYIDDVIEANLRVLEQQPWGETINVGSGQHISINELLEQLATLTGQDANPIYQDRICGDVSHTWANVDKARRLLNWQPTVTLEDGLQRFVDWYQQQQDLYRRCLANP
ncbi:MAG: GDP-mannose 4,6-dehydratase [Thermoplasmatota archaeon]